MVWLQANVDSLNYTFEYFEIDINYNIRYFDQFNSYSIRVSDIFSSSRILYLDQVDIVKIENVRINSYDRLDVFTIIDPEIYYSEYLNYRQTRHNPHSCNLYYSYPAPIDYPYYDVGKSSIKISDGHFLYFSHTENGE